MNNANVTNQNYTKIIWLWPVPCFTKKSWVQESYLRFAFKTFPIHTVPFTSNIAGWVYINALHKINMNKLKAKSALFKIIFMAVRWS